jgi:hypothetical protein
VIGTTPVVVAIEAEKVTLIASSGDCRSISRRETGLVVKFELKSTANCSVSSSYQIEVVLALGLSPLDSNPAVCCPVWMKKNVFHLPSSNFSTPLSLFYNNVLSFSDFMASAQMKVRYCDMSTYFQATAR